MPQTQALNPLGQCNKCMFLNDSIDQDVLLDAACQICNMLKSLCSTNYKATLHNSGGTLPNVVCLQLPMYIVQLTMV